MGRLFGDFSSASICLMVSLQRRIAHVYDLLEARWESQTTERHIATTLIVSFFLSLGLIELSRLGLLPDTGMLALIPTNLLLRH